MSTTKLYLAIPYARKDELKRLLRLNWDKDAKMWYVLTERVYNSAAAVPFHIVNLRVLFAYKDEAKALGAQWNGRNWYVSQHLYDLYPDKWALFQEDDEDEDD